MVKPVHILYVDDNPMDRDLVQHALEQEPGAFSLTHAATQQQFENYINEQCYDLVLSDFNILGFEGLEVICAVQQKCPAVPVIIVTGTGSEEIAVEAMKMGAADYVIKSPSHIRRLPPTIRTVLEKQRMSSALHDSEETFRSLFQNSLDGILLTAPDGRVFKANPTACEMFGMTEEEICRAGRQGLLDLTDPNLPVLLERRRIGGKVCGELRFRHKNGSVFTAEVTSSIFTDSRGEQKTSMSIRDVSLRKQSEKLLEETREKYRLLFECSNDAVVVHDAVSDKFVDANPAAEALWGYTKSELMNIGPLELSLEPEDTIRALEQAKKCGGAQIPIRQQKRKDGSHIFVEISTSQPFFWGNRQIVCSIIRDITDRKKAEHDLKAREEKYRLIVESMQEVVYQADMDGRITFASPSVKLLVGYNPEELLGKRLSDYYAFPEERDHFLRIVKEMGSVSDHETTLVRKDGTRVWVSTNSRLIMDDMGKPIGVEGVTRDITARKEAEELLRQSEDRFRQAFENANIGVCLIDPQGKIIKVNDELCHMFGYTRSELEAMTVNDIAHSQDTQISPQFMQRASSGEIERAEFEKRYVHKQGHVVWGRVSSSLVRDQSGNPLYFVSHVQDLTERKRAEEAAKDNEERYRNLVNVSPDGIAIHHEGKIVFINPAGASMLGAENPDALIGKPIQDIIHPDSWESARNRIQRMLNGETGLYPVEDLYVKIDGTPISVEVIASPFTFEGKLAVQVVARDITQRKQTEAELERLMAAIEQAAEAVIVTDGDGTIQYVNPAFESVTGYSRQEAVGRNPRILKSGEHNTDFYTELWRTIKEGKIWSGRITNKNKNGQLYHEETTISPVRDESGRIVNFVAVKRDITEHLELSKQLFQAQKMEAVGTLAGGVAHDFNNLLQVVLGYSELLLAEEQLTKKFREDLMKIYTAARGGADLVKQLLTFSRKTEIRPLHVDLNRRIEQLQKMLSRTISKMIKMEMFLSEDLWSINADPTQIDQVLMNLAVNSRDAMPEGGRLIIETTNVVLDEEYSRSHFGAKPGPYVLLSLSDTGEGMDKETIQHIFEPFFTTKGPGEGTGLGLATVYGIVKHHDGYIACYSQPGSGTTFKLYFPAVMSDDQMSTVTSQTLPRGGSETILVVDDEEFLRDLGSRILIRAGYRVLTAGNGKEALEIYSTKRNEIDLVILDLIMPEMGGIQCFQDLLIINPLIKVIIASGYSGDIMSKDAPISLAKGFVSKPYDMKRVLELVREALDEQPQNVY